MGLARFRIFHRVFHAGAAAVLHADAHGFDLLAGGGLKRADALGGGIGEVHHLGAGMEGHGLKLG